MKKKGVVVSLGGSLIIPGEVDVKFLKEFRKIIFKHSKNYKFVIVCGGGSLARKYIAGLKDKPYKFQSSSGIAATKANAKFISLFLGQDYLQEIPQKIKKIKKLIKKKNLVICGALDFKPKQTTDSNAAEIAAKIKASFINLTNVLGLYNKNPKKYKNAKFIAKISWKDFDKMANKNKFKPGQHFVLDQTSSKIILRKKVKTYILGTNLKNLDNLLQNKKFRGTIIQD